MTSWGNWDKEELTTLPKITQQYLKAWFTVIANTPRPDSGTCSTGKAKAPLQWQCLQIIPPYPMPPSPLGLVFNLHTFMLKYYILSLFLAAVAGQDQSLMDKWGFYQPHSLQRTCCTHSHSHKSNLLTFPGFTYVLQNTDFKHEPQRGPVIEIIFNSPFTIYHRQGADFFFFLVLLCLWNDETTATQSRTLRSGGTEDAFRQMEGTMSA